jgi:hypothetical protein
MKMYSISAETSTRIFKKWLIEAKNKQSAIALFADKIHRPLKSLKNVRCKLI